MTETARRPAVGTGGASEVVMSATAPRVPPVDDDAYERGYRAALTDVAAGVAELDHVWRYVGRITYAERVTARIAEMVEARERMWPGRPEYCGGPVKPW